MAMNYWQRNGKRLMTDLAGYLLILLSALTGWLPGPGGVPLLLAGLGLLSINNKWAHDLREYVLKNGGRVIEFLFPKNRAIEWGYDMLALLLLVLSSLLIWSHSALWQISLAVAGYFSALFIALMNRDRAGVVKRRKKKRLGLTERWDKLKEHAKKD